MRGLPAPVADRDSAPFWDAAGRGELVVQSCDACGRGAFPPLPVRCPFCRGALSWRAVDGAAAVYSWIGVEHPIHEGEAALVPFSVVLAQLDALADVRIACFFGGPAESLSMGEPGEVRFEDGRPVFQPKSP